LVNSTIGEGTTLRFEERKRIVEEWFKTCRKYQLYCIAQIGGACVADVYDLAEHAEKLGVDAVLVLPELFYKPMCEEDLVNYLKDVAQYCPTRALLYYHYPMYTKVYFSTPRICNLAEREIPNFCGVLFGQTNMEMVTATLKQGRTVILLWETMMLGALTQGVEAVASTMLNFCPEMIVEIFENYHKNKLPEAMDAQLKVNRRVNEIVKRAGDWTMCMKNECNKVVRDFQVGPCRKPVFNVINQCYGPP